MSTVTSSSFANIDDDGSGVAWVSNSVTPAGGSSSYKRFRDCSLYTESQYRIDGVEISAKTWTNASSPVTETWRLYRPDGTYVVLDTDTTQVGSSGTVSLKTVGGPTSLGGEHFDPSEIFNSGFGFGLSVTGPTGAEFVGYSNLEITVYYTELDTTGEHFGGSAEILSTGGPWSDEENALASDGSVASAAPYFSGSEILCIRDWGFSIPSDATISGVVVRIRGKKVDNGYVGLVALTVDSGFALQGDNLAVNDTDADWSESYMTKSYGGNWNDWSMPEGHSLTYSSVSDPVFGVAIRIDWPNWTDAEAFTVDYISCEVFYESTQVIYSETGSGGASCSGSGSVSHRMTISGSGGGHVAGSVVPRVIRRLTGSGLAHVAGSLVPRVIRRITGSGLAHAAGSSTLLAIHRFVGSGLFDVAGEFNLIGETIDFSGSGGGQVSGSGSVSHRITISAAGGGHVAGSGSVVKILIGSAAGGAHATGSARSRLVGNVARGRWKNGYRFRKVFKFEALRL